MRRKIAMVALLGGLATGLGCHHIAGKSDCGYNPADYPIGEPTPPYPSLPASAFAPKDKDKDKEKGVEPIPRSKNVNSDKSFDADIPETSGGK